MIHLIKTLPYSTRYFEVYFDNFYSNIPLFSYLRTLGVGACGTVRTNSSKFPKQLKPSKKKLQCNWNTIRSYVVDGVNVIFWMDNGPVYLLSTIHTVEYDADFVERNRKRPRIHQHNKKSVLDVFGNASVKNLRIPRVIDDYNYNMNGVDVADQLRSYYDTHIVTRRNWYPIFFWILDTCIINAFIMSKSIASTKHLSQKEFRMDIANELINHGLTDRRVTRSYVTQSEINENKGVCKPISKKNNSLPTCRFLPGNHLPAFVNNKRFKCIFCRFLDRNLNGSYKENQNQTSIICVFCNVPLCMNKNRNCFKEFHEKVL